MNVYHILVKYLKGTPDTQEAIQTHYVAIAPSPSRALTILENSGDWRGGENFSVKQAVPVNVPPDIALLHEAVWRI